MIDGLAFKNDWLVESTLSGSTEPVEGVSTPFGNYWVVFYAKTYESKANTKIKNEILSKVFNFKLGVL